MVSQNDRTLIPSDKVDEFRTEISSLGSQEVEFDLDDAITLPPNCLIAPDQIGALISAGIVDPPVASKVAESAPPHPS